MRTVYDGLWYWSHDTCVVAADGDPKYQVVVPRPGALPRDPHTGVRIEEGPEVDDDFRRAHPFPTSA